MVDFGQLTLAIAIALVLGISLLNPGGLLAALIVVGLILLVYGLITMGGPFAADYIVSINKGKKASGRKSVSDSRSQTGGKNGGGR